MATQTFEGWCVFTPEGEAMPWTWVKRSAELCRACYADSIADDWSVMQERGYSVRPVTVIVEERGGDG